MSPMALRPYDIPALAWPAQLEKVMLSIRRLGQPLAVQLPKIDVPILLPEPYPRVMQEIREVGFPKLGVILNAVTPASVMVVLLQEADAP